MVFGETGTSQKGGRSGIGRPGGRAALLAGGRGFWAAERAVGAAAAGRSVGRAAGWVAYWYNVMLFSCLVSLSLPLVHRRAFCMQLPLAMLFVVIPGFGDLDLTRCILDDARTYGKNNVRGNPGSGDLAVE